MIELRFQRVTPPYLHGFREVLKATGLSKPLPHEYCAEYFDRYITEGQIARIQGKGTPYD